MTGPFEILGRPTLNIPDVLTRPTAAATGPVFVDVGADPVTANITRDGVKVPNVVLDNAVVTDLLGSAVLKPRLKVIRQSVEAGRAVERGAAIDLVLSRPDELPLTIVPGIHPGLAEMNVGQVFDRFVQSDTAVRKILASRSDVTTLTTADRETIARSLGQGGIQLDPNDDDAVRGAFSGLQAASLFGG